MNSPGVKRQLRLDVFPVPTKAVVHSPHVVMVFSCLLTECAIAIALLVSPVVMIGNGDPVHDGEAVKAKTNVLQRISGQGRSMLMQRYKLVSHPSTGNELSSSQIKTTEDQYKSTSSTLETHLYITLATPSSATTLNQNVFDHQKLHLLPLLLQRLR